MKRVIIIDDSIVARKSVIKKLNEKNLNWDISEADSGQNALVLCLRQKFDIAILDYNMPGMTGIEFLQTIKEENKPKVIIMLTANIQNSLKNKAKELKIELIEKPATSEKIDFIVELTKDV